MPATTRTAAIAEFFRRYVLKKSSRTFSLSFSLILLGVLSAPAYSEDSPEAPEQSETKSEPAEESPSAETSGEKTPEATSKSKLQKFLEHNSQPGDAEIPAPPQDMGLSSEAKKKREAVTLFMAGRSYEREKKFVEAFEAYQKAIELDPESLDLYRSIIPLALQLQKNAEAIQYARKAVELDPNNFELLSQLGIYALRQRDIKGSIEFFQKAVESDSVDKKAGPYISIMSQLGQLYLSVGENEKAADCYETVYEAITNPDDFNIDFRTQQALEKLKGNKAATLETLGELFLLTNRLERAKEAFSKAAEANPKKSADIDYQLARILNKQEKHEQALEKLMLSLEKMPQDKGKGPYLLLSELYVTLDRKAELIPELEKLSEKNPKNETLLLFLAERYLEESQVEEAEKIYQNLKDSKLQGEVQLGLLQIYRQQKNAEKTLQALTLSMMNGANNDRLEAELELLAQDTELADAVIALAQARDDTGDSRELFSQAYLIAKLSMQRDNYDAVFDFYQRAIDFSQEPRILLTLYGELVEFLTVKKQYSLAVQALEEALDNPALLQAKQALQSQLIRVYTLDKQPEKALEVVQRMRESDPENLALASQEGWVYYMSEDYEKAMEVYGPVLEQAIEQNNTAVEREIRYNLSRCLAFLKKIPEAQELLQQSIEADPKELLWKFQKGWVYYYGHQWDKAIQAFEELLAEEADSDNQTLLRQAQFSLSAAYVQNGELDKGEQILEKFYEKNPDNTSVCNDLGYLYADRDKNLDKAYEMIKKALDAEPENHAYLDSMGWVLYRQGKFEESRKYLEKAVEGSEKGDSVLWDHLGDCYQKLELPEKAQEAWKKALEQEKAATFPDQKLIEKLEKKLQ